MSPQTSDLSHGRVSSKLQLSPTRCQATSGSPDARCPHFSQHLAASVPCTMNGSTTYPAAQTTHLSTSHPQPQTQNSSILPLTTALPSSPPHSLANRPGIMSGSVTPKTSQLTRLCGPARDPLPRAGCTAGKPPSPGLPLRALHRPSRAPGLTSPALSLRVTPPRRLLQ